MRQYCKRFVKCCLIVNIQNGVRISQLILRWTKKLQCLGYLLFYVFIGNFGIGNLGKNLAFFSGIVGKIDSNEVVLQAICHVLSNLQHSKWGTDFSINIEMDSEVAVSWVLHILCLHWKFWNWFRNVDEACTNYWLNVFMISFVRQIAW
ncbi:hypothetical protein GQ457_07G005730 [Hibiscus cannabinus]